MSSPAEKKGTAMTTFHPEPTTQAAPSFAVFPLGQWQAEAVFTRAQIVKALRPEDPILDLIRDELLPMLTNVDPACADLDTMTIARGCQVDVATEYKGSTDVAIRVIFPAPAVHPWEDLHITDLRNTPMRIRLIDGPCAGQTWDAANLQDPDTIMAAPEPDPWSMYADPAATDPYPSGLINPDSVRYRRVAYDAGDGVWLFSSI